MPATNAVPLTFFDSPERLPMASVRAQHLRASQHASVAQVLHGIPIPAVLINAERQVVAANDQFARDVGVEEAKALGRRLGEIVGCVHATSFPSGCGTTEACVDCGAAISMKTAREQHVRSTNDCQIAVDSRAGASLEFRVTATPVQLDGDLFYLVVLRDTFNDNRRRVLERMFFHDVLNAAGGLQGLLENWSSLTPEETAELGPMAATGAATIVDEIQAYRDMVAAERGELAVHVEPVGVPETLALVTEMFGRHEVGVGKQVTFRCDAGTRPLATDAVLLKRVLGNLVKNALEASNPGDTVTMTFGRHDVAWFEVHNATVMPASAQLKVFQRSFSTKAAHGRGLGTYGSRLIVERYLGGRISFVSGAAHGTVFRVELPDPE